jgi:hypothetical protein
MANEQVRLFRFRKESCPDERDCNILVAIGFSFWNARAQGSNRFSLPVFTLNRNTAYTRELRFLPYPDPTGFASSSLSFLGSGSKKPWTRRSLAYTHPFKILRMIYQSYWTVRRIRVNIIRNFVLKYCIFSRVFIERLDVTEASKHIKPI